MPEKSCEAGNNPIASGYAMNARPGPDFTTSVTFIQFLFYVSNKNPGLRPESRGDPKLLFETILYAMCPKNEKTPKPAKTEEKQFPMETINVSRRMLLLKSL